MNNGFPNLRPQAVADFLWHRFQIRPGQALCLALGQPEAQDNHAALIAWAREAIEWYRIDGPEDLLWKIEGDLVEQMFDAGLVDSLVQAHPVSEAVAQALLGNLHPKQARRIGIRPETGPGLNLANNVVSMKRRTRHE